MGPQKSAKAIVAAGGAAFLALHATKGAAESGAASTCGTAPV